MTGFDWHDNFMVARAPTFDEPSAEEAHYGRLGAIAATRTAMPEAGPEARPGPAITLYGARRTDARCPSPSKAPARSDEGMDAGHGRGRPFGPKSVVDRVSKRSSPGGGCPRSGTAR